MEEHLYDELLVELECPICTNYMSPPIRQCATGHSICETCRRKLPKCPLCQGKFTESRNLSLEGLAMKMRYPCLYKSTGCNALLAFNERELHELRCSMKGYKCAMEKCTWFGRLEDLAGHWASKKMSSKPYHKSNICHTKMKSESYYVNIVEAYNNLFWFKCKITNNKLYWVVQYIGNSKDAEKYVYEIEIFKPGRTKKKILMSDYCQAIDLDNSQLFNDDACISIGTETVAGFVSGGEQLLIYYFRVNVVEDSCTPSASTAPIFNNVQWLPGTTTITKTRDRSKGPPNKNYKKKNQQRNQQKNKDGFVLL